MGRGGADAPRAVSRGWGLGGWVDGLVGGSDVLLWIWAYSVWSSVRFSHPSPGLHTSYTNHREACRIANCLDFIEAWDQGFDTVRVLGWGEYAQRVPLYRGTQTHNSTSPFF